MTTNNLLSLCIPTYNRVAYLRELMPSVIAEVNNANQSAIQVQLLVSDNASTDGTHEYLNSLNCPGLDLFRNTENIGGDRNFLACVERASGNYVWLFGDDDVMNPGGIARILLCLSKEQPALLILRDGRHVTGSQPDAFYSTYSACVHEEMKTNTLFPLTHTLITANVFRKDLFDLEKAHARVRTNYGHMYGLLDNLKGANRVGVMSGIYRMRPQRAQFHKWPTALCVKQAIYLWRVANDFNVPRLRSLSIRLALNLPIEILSRCAHRINPRFGRT